MNLTESNLSKMAGELKDLVATPALIVLTGEVGAGKTTFAKYFVDDGDTFSPSYSIISETDNMIHADFYRLKDPEEITHLELPLYLDDRDYFLVEWGSEYLPLLMREMPEEFSINELVIDINKDDTRTFTLFLVEG